MLDLHVLVVEAEAPISMAIGGLSLLVVALVAIVLYCRRAPEAVTRRAMGRRQIVVGALVGGCAGILVVFLGAALTLATHLDGGAGGGPVMFGLALVIGAGAGATAVRCSWHVAGSMTLLGLGTAFAGYLVRAWSEGIDHVITLGIGGRVIAIVLLAAQTMSLIMVVVYAFYSIDGIAKRQWRRGKADVPYSVAHEPVVAFNVCVYNEPPELVIASLRSLLELDYPSEKRLIYVLDDSTDAEACAIVSRFCADSGIRYLHRKDRRGFKAGALNAALSVMPPEVEVIAILDADYQVAPNYLRATVGYFVDPGLVFLQTPQEYRNRDESFLTRQCYLQDAFFYRAIMCSRNEENAIIFCGTMGMLRRSSLVEVGGWGEDYVCEDAEISLRLLGRGARSLYVDEAFGHGLLPSTFEAYKRQQYRWSFGGVKIVKGHWRRFFTRRISMRQKLDFLVGGLHWFDGAYTVAIVATVVGLATADLAGWDFVARHRGDLWIMGLLPFLIIVDGIVRLRLILGRVAGASLRQTLLVMGLWWSIKLSNLGAAMMALSSSQVAFSRTPKSPVTRPTRLAALRGAFLVAKVECALAISLTSLACTMLWQAHTGGSLVLTRLGIAAWLTYYAGFFSMAPLYAYFAARTIAQRGSRKSRSAAREIVNGKSRRPVGREA